MPLSARVIAKGPLVLMGELEGFKLIGEDNALIDIAGRDKLVLCRCGASVNKPFCDGTHTKIGFDAAEAAVHARE